VQRRFATAARPARRADAETGFSVQGTRGWRYEVSVGPGRLAELGEHLPKATTPRVFVLTDSRVRRLHGARLAQVLRRAGREVEWLVVPPGETSKTIATCGRLLDRLARADCDRRAQLLCFGGGVVTDLGGLLASLYMRGIAYANVPTTLVGQLDASVGGKVAVNMPQAKNLVGAFWHPSFVLDDTELLATLHWRDLRAGLAEGLKVGLICGGPCLDLFEDERAALRARDTGTLSRLVLLAAREKMDLIGRDPFENDLRRPLNFGHTLAHPLETASRYRGLRHGEAVAVGMAVATLIARNEGLIDVDGAAHILELLEGCDLLDVGVRPRPATVLKGLRYVRLIRGCSLRFVLPTGVGTVTVVDDLDDAALQRGFTDYKRLLDERKRRARRSGIHGRAGSNGR
jgi:3-dehydroquinate synthase